MARVWALNNGNWSSPAIWSSGAVPILSDDVYLNGYDITLNANPNCILITNELCPDTNQQGGHLVINTTGTRSINAKLIGKNSDHLILDSTNRAAVTLNIVGDVVTENCNFIYYSVNTTGTWQRKEINIQGNLSNNSIFATAIYQQVIHQLQITGGDVILSKIFVATHNTSAQVYSINVINGTLTISNTNSNCPSISVNGNCVINASLSNVSSFFVNGNLELNSDVTATTSAINGYINANTNCRLISTTINIGGYIKYKSNNNTAGIRYTTLNILNPDIFVWQDISSPPVNLFIIITNADVRNQYIYPAENRVVAGTRYAYDELVGSFDADYPPESVVLKDYIYDGGNKEGTLQIPTSPSTSDIVTAIKNDTDLGGKIASTDTNVSDVKSRLGSVNSGTIGSVVDTINTNTQSLSTDLAVVDGNVDTLISRITQNLVDRLGSSVTVQLLQQVLDAHLND